MSESLDAARHAVAKVLRESGTESDWLDARLLLSLATGLSHEALIARGREALQPHHAVRLAGYVRRRLKGEPVSRIRGVREFYGRDFLLSPDTLDPRPDTETLIESVLELEASLGCGGRPFTILDLGTGTGCIVLTLLAELPRALGIGTDINPDALRIAEENARRLGLEDRARFVAADWFRGLTGQFDLIVANPPYIPRSDISGLAREVAGYDPEAALDGGPDGLDAYREIAASAEAFLCPGGMVSVEGGIGQADEIARIFHAAGLRVVSDGIYCDLAGRPRCVVSRSDPGARTGGVPERQKMGLENRQPRARFKRVD